MTLNRQIKTDFNNALEGNMQLEAIRNGIYAAKSVKAGEVITVTKSQARRILAIHKGLFKIKID